MVKKISLIVLALVFAGGIGAAGGWRISEAWARHKVVSSVQDDARRRGLDEGSVARIPQLVEWVHTTSGKSYAEIGSLVQEALASPIKRAEAERAANQYLKSVDSVRRAAQDAVER